MVLLHLSASQFLKLGLETVGFDAQRQSRTRKEKNLDRFRGNFGMGPAACSAAFDDLQTIDIGDARIAKPNSVYFLISINWLAVYMKEAEMAGHFGLDDNTLRTHIKKYVEALVALKEHKIRWDIGNNPEKYLISVDGVQFRLDELRKDPSARWCSYKFKSCGLVYEIAISVYYNKVVWLQGPYHAADGDREIYKTKLRKKMLETPGKLCIADRGYKYDEGKNTTLSIRNSLDTEAVKAFKRRVRARHENFNARIKAFEVLNVAFRAKTDRCQKHKHAFLAVCVLVQYDMENGFPLMEV